LSVWKAAFQDKAVHLGEGVEERLGQGLHRFGHVLPGGRLQEAACPFYLDDAHGVAGDAKPDLDLGADGHELDVGTQPLHKIVRDDGSVVPAAGKPQALADDNDGLEGLVHGKASFLLWSGSIIPQAGGGGNRRVP
jgi:hypothetical protein